VDAVTGPACVPSPEMLEVESLTVRGDPTVGGAGAKCNHSEFCCRGLSGVEAQTFRSFAPLPSTDTEPNADERCSELLSGLETNRPGNPVQQQFFVRSKESTAYLVYRCRTVEP